MSCATISLCANDGAFRSRLTAALAQEGGFGFESQEPLTAGLSPPSPTSRPPTLGLAAAPRSGGDESLSPPACCAPPRRLLPAPPPTELDLRSQGP